MPGQSAMPAADDSTAAVHVMSARLGGVRAGGQLPALAEFLAAVPVHRLTQRQPHSLLTILVLPYPSAAAGGQNLVPNPQTSLDRLAPVVGHFVGRRTP